jgi:hypothetical protein
MKKLIVPALAAGLIGIGSIHSQAQILGVNFYDGSATGQQVSPTDTLGGSSTGWYNNVEVGSQKPANVALTDSTDTLTTTTFSINPSGTAGNGNSTTYSTSNNGVLNGGASGLTPEQQLYNGYIATANNNYFTTELSLSNIPYASYDVLVYVLTNQYASAKAQLVTGGATGPSYYLADGVPFYEGNNLPTTYSLATSTSAATPTVGANYFAFTGLTGASQTIDLNADVSAGYNNATKDEFVGFEIVNTASAPEPSTYALLMAGAFVLGALRLRRTVNS